MKLFLKLSFFLLFTFSSSAFATAYFDAKTISPTLLNAPNQKNSKEWNEDVNQIVKLQKNADKNEVAKADKEKNLTPEELTLAIDKNLTRESYPKLYIMLDRVAETSNATSFGAKSFWLVKRPHSETNKIKALIEKSYSPGYPSGHSCYAFAMARILAEIFPDKRNELMKRAEEISIHRVLVGLHYFQDAAAGKELALLLTGALMHFIDDFKDAKKEAKERD